MTLPNLAETLLLVVARRARSRGTASIERSALLESARSEHDVAFDGSLDPLEPALDALVGRGAFRAEGDLLTLDADAARSVAAIDRARFCRSFDDWMLRCAASPASLELTRRSTGLPFLHFATIDTEQTSALLRAIDARPGTRVVDLGCGLGMLAEHVSDETGARVTGLDFAPRCVAAATERTAEKRARLEFRIGDLDALDLPPASFDVALAIDTLYFVEDLTRTLREIGVALAPGGRLIAFYDSILRPGGSPSTLEPETSVLGLALAELGWRTTTTDFTERERAFWSTQRDLAGPLKDVWEREGNLRLWQSADREARVMTERHEAGLVRRHLYVATR